MQTKNLLIVDDSRMVRKIISVSLKGEKQFTLYEAASGLEALDKISEFPEIGIVLSDINMPEMDGLALAERLSDFREVVHGFGPEGACAEANRCLRCDLEKLRS